MIRAAFDRQTAKGNLPIEMGRFFSGFVDFWVVFRGRSDGKITENGRFFWGAGKACGADSRVAGLREPQGRIDPKSRFFAKKDQKKSILSKLTKMCAGVRAKSAENVYFKRAETKELILFC
jgi:hypothetical protein